MRALGPRAERRLARLVVLLLAAAGCNRIAGIHEGTAEDPHRCDSVGQCRRDPAECGALACVRGRCVYAIAGTPLLEQTPGDCVALVCDGAGGTELLVTQEDVPDDGNPCTLDLCDGSTPAHVSLLEAECYSGPAWTRNVGTCREGIQRCDAGGNPVGACEGEMLPAEETCLSAFDEDCDGAANESGSGCTCGDGYLSEGEACDDANTVDGDSCTAGCRFPVLEIAAAAAHTCALMSYGRVKCWGLAIGLELASTFGDMPGEMGNDLPHVDLGAGAVVTAIATRFGHACALLNDGGVKCWGANDAGQLGLGDTADRGDQPDEMGDELPAVNLGAGATAVAIATGRSHTCALLDGGRVKCWGSSARGQLGLGETADRGDQPNEMGDSLPDVNLGASAVAVAIVAAEYHTCALLQGGQVKCWGDNTWGQLGLGEDEPSRGDEPGEMGDALPPVDLGAGRTATAIAAAEHHTCASLDDGSLKCWGDNTWGQLGQGNIQSTGAAPGTMGDALPPVDLGTGATAVAVAAGVYHTCALLDSGPLKCWGYSHMGQLGTGDISVRGDGPGEMGDALPEVDLGTGRVATSVVAGPEHTCALLSGGLVRCWGYNLNGQLGVGDVDNRGDEPGEMGDSLPLAEP